MKGREREEEVTGRGRKERKEKGRERKEEGRER